MEEKALELENRRNIYQYILKYPGTYLREMQKGLGMQVGVLEYHLNYLEKKEIISSQMDGYRKRYYSREEISHSDKGIIALLRQKVPRRVVVHLMLNPGASFQEVLGEFKISKSTLSFHLKKLVQNSVIEEKKEGRTKIYKVVDEERTARIIITYKASFVDDVVDRFVEAWLEL